MSDRGRSCSSPTTRRRSASAPSRALHEREDVVFALIGGDVRHGGGAGAGRRAAVPRRCGRPSAACARLAASGRFRAVVAGLSGRVALPAAWLGARRARVPFVLWATIWAHPRTPAHALSYLPLRAHLPRRRRDRHLRPARLRLRARQGRPRARLRGAAERRRRLLGGAAEPERRAPFQALFAGRLAREKGVCVLLRAWPLAGLSAPPTALVLVGDGPIRARAVAAGAAHLEGPLPPERLRNFYAGSDVVVVPSIPTRDFLEPWGLVVNEAFDQGVPVIATDAVGAAAGGLVQHERTGLVVPAGDERGAGRRAAPPARRPGAARAARGERARGGARRTPTPPGRRA